MRTKIARVRKPDDFQKLTAILAEYERSLPPELRHGDEPELDVVQTAYCEPDAAFLAFVGGATAGAVVLTALDASSGVMKRLYVKPSYRGLGLARMLINALIEFARKRRLRRVVLDTDRERLPAAYALYVSMDFRQCAPYGIVGYHGATFLEFLL